MNEAQALFHEGVMVLRERKDVAEGRRLLIEALRADPNNDMAWVWLARTTRQPEKRLECLDRALRLNPTNQHAIDMKAAIQPIPATTGADNQTTHHQPTASGKTLAHKLTAAEERQIAVLLKKADHYVDTGDTESAIEQWVSVLHIQVDHEEAMRQAVSQLARLKYLDDARVLVWRALDAGTTHPSIYLTAIDIARRDGTPGEVDDLRERLAQLPDIDEQTIVNIANQFMAEDQVMRAQEMLEAALDNHPNSQLILTKIGDIYRDLDDEHTASRYYDQAARIGAGTKAGREADKKLAEFAPLLTDRERGSLVLAWREAAGFGLIFLFLAWQDAGLDLLRLGPGRWAGVLMGLFGGYLLVTATSSPQQQPLARWLGGHVPDHTAPARERTTNRVIEDITEIPIIPRAARFILGAVGAVLLGLAVWLVFGMAIQLLLNPITPTSIPTFNDPLFYGF